MNHSFDIAVAKDVGVNAAVIFQNIAFWCEHSRANGTNYHDGAYWTYNSNKAFGELFPYLTSKAIRGALQKLIDADYIKTGNYNSQKYDRTLWYSLTKKGNSIFQKGQIEMPERANRNARKGEPIPDINPDINHDIKGTQNGFDRFWAVYPRRVSKEMAVRAWKKLKPDEGLIEVIMTDIEHRKEGEWKNQDIRYIPHPATYLNQRRWEDEQTTKEDEWHEPDLEEVLRRGGYYPED